MKKKTNFGRLWFYEKLKFWKLVWMPIKISISSRHGLSLTDSAHTMQTFLLNTWNRSRRCLGQNITFFHRKEFKDHLNALNIGPWSGRYFQNATGTPPHWSILININKFLQCFCSIGCGNIYHIPLFYEETFV